MNTKLRDYFPMIRERKEVLQIIHDSEELQRKFYEWGEEQRREFLDFCSGARGVKMLYDAFSKELLNPETVPERLEELLSLLLNKNVKIVQVLPNDNSRIADEMSLLVMDIVVRMEDGSTANVEIQKIGYQFPGQRSACYSADLLLRQYKMVRDEKKKAFSYRDIKNVYTIVFFEKSAEDFHAFPEKYKHCFSQKSDTGLELELLQEFIFVPLDIYRKNCQNKTIENRLEAWLLFFSSDDPEDIVRLIETYPDFRAMYEQVYYICRNIEGVMNMFSEELRILDRNTVKYMMDELQNKVERKDAIIAEQGETIAEKDEVIAEKDEKIAEQGEMIAKKDEVIAEKDALLVKQEAELQEMRRHIAELEKG